MNQERKDELSIVESETGYYIRMSGNSKTMLFYWALLTKDICDKLHISPISLGLSLPEVLDGLDSTGVMANTIEFDLNALVNGKDKQK